jgi:hypothetical protein
MISTGRTSPQNNTYIRLQPQKLFEQCSERINMRSAKETGCFPYSCGQVCYMEVSPDGAVTQLSTVGEKRSAYINAQAGVSKILAVWPGRWRSDLFIIDDLDAFSEKQGLFGRCR